MPAVTYDGTRPGVWRQSKMLIDRVRAAGITPAELSKASVEIRADEEAFEKVMAFGACAPFEKDLVRLDGTTIPVLFGAALHDDEIACFVVDLSQNKQAQEKLNHLAYHDALTDLPNQVLFKDRLKQAIAYSRRSDQMHGVLLLNLDRFKTINDSLSYTAGDRLLVRQAGSPPGGRAELRIVLGWFRELTGRS